MNQVTTKTTGDGGPATLVPALGESFAHTCTTRVLLFWRGHDRHAHLYKSPRLPQVTTPALSTLLVRLVRSWVWELGKDTCGTTSSCLSARRTLTRVGGGWRLQATASYCVLEEGIRDVSETGGGAWHKRPRV
jgi:hypothetical protein